jgi:hypothetical protein
MPHIVQQLKRLRKIPGQAVSGREGAVGFGNILGPEPFHPTRMVEGLRHYLARRAAPLGFDQYKKDKCRPLRPCFKFRILW